MLTTTIAGFISCKHSLFIRPEHFVFNDLSLLVLANFIKRSSIVGIIGTDIFAKYVTITCVENAFERKTEYIKLAQCLYDFHSKSDIHFKTIV